MERTEVTIQELLDLLNKWGCLNHLTTREVERISEIIYSIPQFAKEDLINQLKNL